MRRYLLLVVAACTIPDKEPSEDSPGGGTSMPTGPIETRITQAPATFSKDEVAKFEFTSNVASAKFTCRIDDKQPVDCTSPFSKRLDDGSHHFSVRASDGGTSDDSPAEHLWTIDTVAPKTTLTAAPPATDNSTTVTFEFSANEDNVTFECSVDSSAFAACRSGNSFGPLGDGEHRFAVRAKDRAGNVDPSPAKHEWDVDTSMPDTQIVDGPPNASPSRTATFAFTSPDAGAGAFFECALDNDPFFFCTSPRTYVGLREGDHTFRVRVRDLGGNVDPTPATDTWRVDLTPPRTMITSAPSGAIAATSASFAFTADESEVTFFCSLDGAAFAQCTSPYNAMGLAQGPHVFAVRATDAASHDDPTPATASWTVDMDPPSIQIVGGPDEATTVGPHVTMMFTTSEGATECSVDSGPFAACTSPTAYNLPAGAHSFSVRATDGAGNSASVMRSWTIACSAPDPTDAAGLLHFDDWTQLQPDATGGPMATLGLVDVLELVDPLATPGRFGGGLTFDANEGDLVSWPLGLGRVSDLTIELWVRPDALDGSRDVVVNGDRRIAINVAQVTATTVSFWVTVSPGLGFDIVTSPPVSANEWHWVHVTLNEPRLRLRVDSTTTTANNVRVGPDLQLDDLRVGGNFGGAIDELYVSRTAQLSDDSALPRYCPR